MPRKRMVSRLKRRSKPIIKPKIFNLGDFWNNRDKILIVRAVGGLGDILMHRMIFEGFKEIMPSAEIHFACPQRYHPALDDHPFIDKLLDSDLIDKSELFTAIVEEDKQKELELRGKGYFLRQDYIISYITTTVCGRTEVGWAPYSKLHRSDIWAGHCGVELTNHNMRLTVDPAHRQKARELIDKARQNDGPVVAFCPISAMTGKNLEGTQITETLNGLLDRKLSVLGVHNSMVCELEKMGIPLICQASVKTWIALIDEVDFVVTVDSAAFHCAGGLGKPMVGIFSWADGKVYGQYYSNWELVQHHRDNGNWNCGPCYNWGCCSLQQHGHRKPCITEISSEMILDGVDRLLTKIGIKSLK